MQLTICARMSLTPYLPHPSSLTTTTTIITNTSSTCGLEIQKALQTNKLSLIHMEAKFNSTRVEPTHKGLYGRSHSPTF